MMMISFLIQWRNEHIWRQTSTLLSRVGWTNINALSWSFMCTSLPFIILFRLKTHLFIRNGYGVIRNSHPPSRSIILYQWFPTHFCFSIFRLPNYIKNGMNINWKFLIRYTLWLPILYLKKNLDTKLIKLFKSFLSKSITCIRNSIDLNNKLFLWGSPRSNKHGRLRPYFFRILLYTTVNGVRNVRPG
jgi:hypothetical protein